MSGRFSRFLTPPEVARLVGRLGAAISVDHPDGVVLVGMLKDSAIFLADLARAIETPVALEFMALSAYEPGAARVRVMKDLDHDVGGRDVVLVRDIVDTGLSVRYVLDLLSSRGARHVQLCALLDRPKRHILPLEPDYLGRVTDEPFLVGYGLDLAERFRNLPGIYAVDPLALAADPDAAITEAYAGALPLR